MNKSIEQQTTEILDEITLCAQAATIDEQRVREIAGFAREHGRSLVDLLVERSGVGEVQLTCGLASLLDLPSITEEVKEIPEYILGMVSPALAIKNHVIPLREENGKLHVACWNPFDWQSWDDLAHMVGRELERVLCPRSVVERMLKEHYGIGAETVERLLAGRSEEEVKIVGAVTTDLSEADAANEPTVVNLVNQILTEAIRANATDVHFEPYDNKFRIRYRIDGMLEDVSMPVSVSMLKLALVSRVKIMSNLDISEKRLPQDGRCQVALAGQEYDLRVSILPGIHGEAVVIRLQSRQMTAMDLDALGFEQEEQNKTKELITRPHGLVLVTGPTGSGKTTTLYTCLSNITSPETKIITIEDPIEYRADDILQMQVHETIGFSFARALRHMLRHDPDVLLVGEIRDRETADIAIRSSLTGHLVFATLHTNDAASAITRLIDVGIEPFLAASSVHGVLAQRLVRRVCSHCVRELNLKSLSEYEHQLLREAGLIGTASLRKGRGCEKCRFTGYRGRMAIGEVMVMSTAIRRLVQMREPSERIKELACKEGMRTLRESAMLAVKEGKTDISEVLRITQEDL